MIGNHTVHAADKAMLHYIQHWGIQGHTI